MDQVDTVNLVSVALVLVIAPAAVIAAWPVQRRFLELRRSAAEGAPPSTADADELGRQLRGRMQSALLITVIAGFAGFSLNDGSLRLWPVFAAAAVASVLSAWVASAVLVSQVRHFGKRD